MKFNSDIVGSVLKEFHAEADWRHITNYAASVGDYNPRYFNDEVPEKMIAHPMYAVALSWPLIANISDYIDLQDAAPVLLSIVHYTEFIEFHRPVKPGDRLTAVGSVAAVIPRRGGTHVVFKIPFKDRKGNVVFTEYLGGLLRGVECADSGRGSENLPYVPDVGDTGDPVWEVTEYIDAGAPYIYDGCSDIVFAIHTSPAFARSVGLPGIILQGTATLARAVRELINREAGGVPEHLAQLSCRFRAMVLPEQDIKIRLIKRRETTNGRELFFDVLNSSGKAAVSNGYALIIK